MVMVHRRRPHPQNDANDKSYNISPSKLNTDRADGTTDIAIENSSETNPANDGRDVCESSISIQGGAHEKGTTKLALRC
jgi:hypothetical protein